jgi:opacity protein-like surface antigen
MKKWTVPVLALAFLTMLTATAYSQVGIYLGGYGGVSAQKPSLEGVNFDTNTTFLYGLRGGVRFLMFAVELNYFMAGHNIEPKDYLLFNLSKLENDYSYIGLNLRYIFALAMLHPYLTAGYGYYTADIHNINKDTEGGWNFGAGLEIMLGSKFSILAEGKYHKVTVNITSIQLGLGDFTCCAGLNVYF